MEPVELVMVRDSLSDLPRFDLPRGYSFRRFQRGDAEIWAEIETSAGEFPAVDRGIDRFRDEFGDHQEELSEHCFFIQIENGDSIGTVMAWFGSRLPGGPAGRLHWVGIRREYQGRGLGKPLVSRAMQSLAILYDRAYLTSHSFGYRAIKIYRDFGFKPYITDQSQATGWSEVAKRTGFL